MQAFLFFDLTKAVKKTRNAAVILELSASAVRGEQPISNVGKGATGATGTTGALALQDHRGHMGHKKYKGHKGTQGTQGHSGHS